MRRAVGLARPVYFVFAPARSTKLPVAPLALLIVTQSGGPSGRSA